MTRVDEVVVTSMDINVDAVEFRGSFMYYEGRPAGQIKDGGMVFVDSHYLLVFQEWLNAQPEEENTTEAQFRDSIADQLAVSGWHVITEQYTSQGRIDVLAKGKDEVRIIEVKMSGSPNAAAHALGQLLFYSKFHPEASLWFASPEKPDSTILSILNFYGVKYHEASN